MRLLILFCFIQFGAHCQEITKPEKTPTVIDRPVEDTLQIIEFGGPEPEFVGGRDSLIAFIARNCVYPQKAIDQGIEGKVLMRFIVESDGSLSEIQVARSVHPLLDAEATRLISIMPNWKPLSHKGKPLRMWAGLPIVFSLPKEE